MRTIPTDKITSAVIELARRANFELSVEVVARFTALRDDEDDAAARSTLDIILENAEIARREQIPLCQDCGTAIVLVELGQDVRLEGKLLDDAVNEGIGAAYEKYFLRKSIVGDPLRRRNTGTNTPAFIHAELVPGDRVRVTVYLKGGGSENMSSLKMFNPTASEDDIIAHIAETVKAAGPNPCPPLFLGVGIGGTADIAMLNSKKAVLRGVGTRHHDPYYAELEARILGALNATGVGPLGFGGRSTAAAVYIKEAPTHIATLPVALNLNCHSLRYGTAEL
ncbi:MAG: fumarate hydratase [Spirochaetes bacterium]|nr:fumarate hydratase [Spirochaetota bacterium]